MSDYRTMRQAARCYVESMEAERVDLKRRVADLTRALDDASRHRREAHGDCTATNAPAAPVEQADR